MTNKALLYHAYGKPSEVLCCQTLEIPEPQPGQVLLKMEAGVINPSDFGQILGNYGSLKELPAVAGREGVARVMAVKLEGLDGAPDLQPGDLVRIPPELGAWQELLVADARGLQRVPQGIDTEQVAMSFINPPTAWRVLNDFVALSAGDWIIQNAANSAVGISLIQLAKERGIRTINIVRREELLEPLKALGADLVLLDDKDYPKRIKELTHGCQPKLALNSVGGESSNNLIKTLADRGVHITIGAMNFEATRYPTRYLIFNDVQLRGFWLDRWLREAPPEATQSMYDNIYARLRDGRLRIPVSQRFPLDAFPEALRAAQSARLGKVLFTASYAGKPALPAA